jgi:AcrR family transcriptional regulator
MSARDRILDATMRLLCQYGVHVSMGRVVVEAGVAPMTVYRHFGGKDDLVAATLEAWSGQRLCRLRSHLDRFDDGGRARRIDLGNLLEQWLVDECSHGSLINHAAVELRGSPGHPAQRVIAAHRATTQQLLERLANAAGACDPAGLAVQLQLAIDGAVAAAVADGRLTAAALRRLVMAALAFDVVMGGHTAPAEGAD